MINNPDKVPQLAGLTGPRGRIFANSMTRAGKDMKTMFPLIVGLLLGILSTTSVAAAEQNRAVVRAVRGTATFSTVRGANWKRWVSERAFNKGA